MDKHLEASISIIDHLNPGFGYQLTITDGRNGSEMLRTACNPATGVDLLTFEHCLDVLEMYRRDRGAGARPWISNPALVDANHPSQRRNDD